MNKRKKNSKVFTLGEEIANAVTHGIGALMGIVALCLLIVFASLKGNIWHIISFTIYGVSFLILYMNSTLYHAITNKKAKHVFEILDHSSIYVFIAGTYTPFALTILRESKGWYIFVSVWSITVIGVVLKVFFVKRFEILSTLIYILMGWMIVIDYKFLGENFNKIGLRLLVVGGVLYTVGTIFYTWKRPKYFHAVWHIFVILGSISHFFSVLYLL